jgi:hypothetical protein
MAISWVGFVGFIAAFYCCARALWDGDPAVPLPTLTQHFLIVPMGLVIAAIPGFPGGAGIGELGFGFLYEWFGYLPGLGQMSTLLQRLLTWLIGFGGYLVYARMKAETQPVASSAVEAPDELRLRPEAEATSAG